MRDQQSRPLNLIRFPFALVGAWQAVRGARDRVDLSFAHYARRVALRLLGRAPWRHRRTAAQLLATPVSSVRYWEFPFVWANLPSNLERCLDVASPRLFSLRAADQRSARILMLNPDLRDAQISSSIAGTLGLPIRVQTCRVDELVEDGFDCVWSISVVEHIAGDAGDSAAVRTMVDALSPGGRLIITVPVDRAFRLEFRSADPYGLVEGDGDVFFQRFYDVAALRTRLIAAIGLEPTVTRWYGERMAGTFETYTQRWLREGWPATVADPIHMADGYRDFPSWDAMPGVGVVGLVFDKPSA